MPSPPIPRSHSAPKISGTPPSPNSDVLPVPSNRSVRSENSPRTYWPKKLDDFLARKGSTSSKNHAKLTEESLQEFNRLNEILEQKRYLSYSPYYRGLTDSSLVTNPQRPSLPSPDRESHAASLFSSGSKSSIVLKMQEWGSSCFVSSKDKKDRSSQSSSEKSTKSSRDPRTPTSSSSTSSSRTKAVDIAMLRETSKTSLKEPSSEKKEVRSSIKGTSDVPYTLLYNGKPLRERISQPPSPPPTPPHPPLKATRSLVSPLTTQSQPAQRPQTLTPTMQKSAKISETLPSQTQPGDSAVQEKEGNTIESDSKYTWADKYRPFALKDFVCNRSTALQLQALVKYPS